MEQWLSVENFPEYEVSDLGRVRNKRTRRILKPLDNKRGTLMVILKRDGRGYSRSLRRLVANAFDPMGDREDIAPIHLDCDYRNCAADNLEWRPRRFAYEWVKQNSREPINTGPIVDINTDKIWDSAWHAARDLHLTEHLVIGIINTTDRFGHHIGNYKGHELRYIRHYN